MGKLLKFPLVMLVVFLLALSPIACGPPPWESVISLTMTVVEPKHGDTVSVSPVTVSGTLSKSANVTVNGTPVTVKGGKFSTAVTLTPGNNDIKVIATVGEETVSQSLVVIYMPAKQ